MSGFTEGKKKFIDLDFMYDQVGDNSESIQQFRQFYKNEEAVYIS